MKSDTWEAIERLFSEDPVMRASEVPYDEIDAAAAKAEVQLEPDYREFVHRYGGAIVGAYRVFGLRRAPAMARKDNSAFEITQEFRRQGWPGVSEWLIISVDLAGNPIGIDKDGKVWISDHDARVVETIASSFENYLRDRCLGLQS